MQTLDGTQSRTLWPEEMNRTRQEIQSRWTAAERSHRRQLAHCQQQALARLLAQLPLDRSRPPMAH